jgi:nucleotide-binding universal stress UspA family protein
MNRILVPVDFSPCAENAIDFAARLAQKLNKKITLFHSYDIPYASGYMPFGIYADEMAGAKEVSDRTLKKLADEVQNRYGISCKILSGHELTDKSILKAARDEKVDLIVMGTVGEVTLSKHLSGTHALAVSEHAECPVMIVPDCWKFRELKNIAITAGYETEDLDRIAHVIELLKQRGAHFSLVHVTAKHEDRRVEAARFLEALREKTNYKDISVAPLPQGSVTERLDIYLEERPVDLLVLAPHHHSLLGKLFGKSLSKEMIAHPKTPLLTVHE